MKITNKKTHINTSRNYIFFISKCKHLCIAIKDIKKLWSDILKIIITAIRVKKNVGKTRHNPDRKVLY